MRLAMRLLVLAIAAFMMSGLAATRWPAELASAPRLVLANRRVVGFRMGTTATWLPRGAVDPANGALALLALLWIGLEIAARRRPAPPPPKPVEKEYFSPEDDRPALRAAVGPGAPVARPPAPPAPPPPPPAAPPPAPAAPLAPPSTPGTLVVTPQIQAQPHDAKLDEAEELERAVAKLDADDPGAAIDILEVLLRRAYKIDLVSYYLAVAYAACRRPDDLRTAYARLKPDAMPVARRYKLACVLEEARLYELALPLLKDLQSERRRYPDLADRLTRVRDIMFDGGPEAFDRQLIALLDPRYTGAKVLASGGMGIVFTATDSASKSRVAIKMLSPLLRNDEQSSKRFLREGQVLQAMSHPNLVRTFAVHPTPCPHYSMEFLEGKTLAKVIQTESPLPLARIRHLALQMLAALDYCHQLQVFHRDIKPANVLVPDASPLKLIDFGLVRSAMISSITVEGTVMGTPPYMPPEQLAGEEVDATADLYSFGVVLYELATGRLPFPPGDTMTQNIIHGRYAPATAVRADLPPALDQVIGRLIHKDRRERPQRAANIAEAIAQVLPA